jgi:Tol biopolymer transport system component
MTMRLAAVLGRVLVTVAALLSCSDAIGPGPLDRTPIFFANLGDTGWEIVRVDWEGGDWTVLTTSPDHDEYPSIAPDRQSLAFFSRRTPEGIYRMNLDGSSTQFLVAARAEGPGLQRRVAWSPDMTRLAFTSADEGLVITRVDGTERAAILEDAYGPAWSPDGELIAVHMVGGPTVDIHVMKPDGSQRRMIIQDAVDPAWSPDGTQIAFARNRLGKSGIYIADASGANERRIVVGGPDPHFSADDSPTWSPTGEWLAFQRWFGHCVTPDFCQPQFDVFVVRRDGRGFRNITNGGGESVRPTW